MRVFSIENEEWKTSLQLMKEQTGCDTVVLPVQALQDHTYCTQIDYTTPDVLSLEDMKTISRYAQSIGLKVIVKAMVNCRDGYWRAYIRFFDNYVPTEPTWEQWFASYDAFVVALAKAAEEVNADMFCIGCEMVGADHREAEWRDLIAQVRQVYHGPLTYNCDKFQENYVTWWDALDVISSSGYYPIDQLDEHLSRIEEVARRENKPFFFIESGCPSRMGSDFVPNDWRYGGDQDNETQRRWYKAFTDAVLRHPLIEGTTWWDWSSHLYDAEKAATDDGYGLYCKPVVPVLQEYSRRVRKEKQ